MHDTIIIGAGIAGLTAALYASRKRMDFLILSSDFGGQFNVSGKVYNYPGIVETTGQELTEKMMKQMKENDVNVKQETVESIEKSDDGFIVKTGKSEYETKTVIIAAGARARKLGVPGEEELANKGVTYCSICDGPLFKGKDVAIIGAGNAGLEGADFMLDIAKSIKIIDTNNESPAHEYLKEKILDHEKVEFINKADVKEIYGDKFVEGLKYEKDGEEHDLKVQGVIIEIGRVPNTDFLGDFVEKDEHDHIKIDCRTHTSQEGVFAAGDCASGHEYQYVIAAGQGCMALLKVARYLANRKE
ncbi:FAD-binding protein [Candidatus Woesearchaeota archaeon]|nr:FAD-binding protein [Candidatus Woesearchaeota archaeon]